MRQKESGSESALSFLARTYLKKSPCPVKADSQSRRDDILLSIIKNSKADGVIFILLKLCDTHSLNFNFLKKALDKEGFPYIVIEYEQQTKSYQQIQTRVEAFVETIKGY